MQYQVTQENSWILLALLTAALVLEFAEGRVARWGSLWGCTGA